MMLRVLIALTIIGFMLIPVNLYVMTTGIKFYKAYELFICLWALGIIILTLVLIFTHQV